MKENILKKVGIGFGAFLLPAMALAADTSIPQVALKLDVILQNVLNWMAGIIGLFAVVMLFYAAFMYITGGASPDAVSKAKSALIYAIVGIVVALLAWTVIPLIKSIFGLGGY